MGAVGIAVLLLGLVASVGIHELGHLIPAKKFGVKVSQYFIGFGPTLWSKKIRGTEYGIKALPLGGFVRIAGMLPPGRPGRKKYGRSGRLTMAEEARQDSAKELEPGEESQAFWRLSAPKKLAVMFGGPFTNLVLAVLCLCVALCGIGTPKASATLETVSPCVGASPCASSSPASPAHLAGLKPSDTILSWGDTRVTEWEDVYQAIQAGGVEPVQVTLERDGERITTTVSPVEFDSSAGTRPYVGISPHFVRERHSLSEIPSVFWRQTSGTFNALATLPKGLWTTTKTLFTGQERDGTGAVGIVGVAGIAGSITSADSSAYDWASRLADLIMLIGSLNLTLFLFNLIPLLPLDGGHLAGATYEGLRRTVARWRGKPDPGPVDTARLMPLSYAVAMVFIAMTLLLVIVDVLNPVHLF